MNSLKRYILRAENQFQNWFQSRIPGGRNFFSAQALLDQVVADVESRIRYFDSETPVFPYNHICVRFKPATQGDIDLLNSPASQDFILRTLREKLVGCRINGSLRIQIQIGGQGDASMRTAKVEVICENENELPRVATLQVIGGIAFPTFIELARHTVQIGRRDESFRTIEREADITFEAAENTVARKHAVVSWDSATGSYVVADAKTSYGTTVYRRGKQLAVGPLGLILQPGDEIVLGRARVRYDERAFIDSRGVSESENV